MISWPLMHRATSFITPLSAIYGRRKVHFTAPLFIVIMCGSMSRLAVYSRGRVDGSRVAKVQPLDARYGPATSHSLMARRRQLYWTGRYQVGPRRTERDGII